VLPVTAHEMAAPRLAKGIAATKAEGNLAMYLHIER
jgi:hypothetical protein